MTLLLDGQEVRGKYLKVTGNLRIESDDLSGQTSNTDKGHKGFKPKTLTVSLLIPFVDQAQLRDLMRLVEATEGGGQLKTYRIVNDTAAAFGMRQVTFTGGVSAREDENPNKRSSPIPRNWRCSTSLKVTRCWPSRMWKRKRKSLLRLGAEANANRCRLSCRVSKSSTNCLNTN